MPGLRHSIALSAAIAAFVSVSMQSAAAAHDPTPKGWQTYINTKYDFDICYPPSLVAQTPAPAGDGQKFTGPGGGTLTVFWRPGTPGDTLARTVDEEATIGGRSPAVTYTRRTWGLGSTVRPPERHCILCKSPATRQRFPDHGCAIPRGECDRVECDGWPFFGLFRIITPVIGRSRSGEIACAVQSRSDRTHKSNVGITKIIEDVVVLIELVVSHEGNQLLAV